MSQDSDYKNIKQLAILVGKRVDKLESGKLSEEELSNLLEETRTLYERITVLQYLAFEKKVKKDEVKEKEVNKPKKESKKKQENFTLNFGTPETKEESDFIEKAPNQINLLDAIEEQVDEPVETKIKEEKGTPKKAAKSVNEKFAEDSAEKTLADKLGRQPITDLKEAIGLNQKFLFMNDLFEGENTFFNEAVEMINKFENLEQAKEYVDNVLSLNYKWEKGNKSVKVFVDLIERRFMA